MSGSVSYCPPSWLNCATDRLSRFFSDLCYQGLDSLIAYCSIGKIYSQNPGFVIMHLRRMARISPVPWFHHKYVQDDREH